MGIENISELEFKLYTQIKFLGRSLKSAARKCGMSVEEAENLYKNIEEKSARNRDYYLKQSYFDVYLASSYRRFEQLRRIISVEKRLLEMGYKVFSPLNVRSSPVRLGILENEMMRRRCKTFFGIMFAETFGLLSELRIFIEHDKPTVLWTSKRKEFIKRIHPTIHSSDRTSPHISADLETALGCLRYILAGKLETYEEDVDGIPVKKCKRCHSILKVLKEVGELYSV